MEAEVHITDESGGHTAFVAEIMVLQTNATTILSLVRKGKLISVSLTQDQARQLASCLLTRRSCE